MPDAARFAEIRCVLEAAYDGPVPSVGNRMAHREGNTVCWLLRQGEATVRLGGWERRVGPGTWIVLPPDSERDQRFAAGTRQLSLRFAATWRGLPLIDRGLPLLIPAAAAPDLEHAGLALVHTLADLTPPGLPEWRAAGGDLAGHGRIQAALWPVVLALHAAALAQGAACVLKEPTDRRLAVAIAVLDAHARAGAVPYPLLRQRTGLSRVHLDRLFQRHLGSTPRDWLDRLLRDRASDQLRHGSAAKTVAHQLAFADASHFTKWFRRQVGCTPGAFAQRRGA